MKKLLLLACIFLFNTIPTSTMSIKNIFKIYQNSPFRSGDPGTPDYWLMIAAWQGDIDKVKEYLTKISASDINADEKLWRASFSVSPLFAAVINNHPEAVRLLLQYGADPNITGGLGSMGASDIAIEGEKLLIRDELGLQIPSKEIWQQKYSPVLVMAAVAGYKDIVELLLDSGANPSITDAHGRTASDLAANQTIRQIINDYVTGKKKPTRVLLGTPMHEPTKPVEPGKKPGPTPPTPGKEPDIYSNDKTAQEKFFHAAIRCDTVWLEKFATMPGVNVNATYPSYGALYPVLFYVLYKCPPNSLIDIVTMLLRNGVDPNVVDSTGETSIIWAARLKMPKAIVELLLNAGANPNVKDHKGNQLIDMVADADIQQLIQDYRDGTRKPTKLVQLNLGALRTQLHDLHYSLQQLYYRLNRL